MTPTEARDRILLQIHDWQRRGISPDDVGKALGDAGFLVREFAWHFTWSDIQTVLIKWDLCRDRGNS